MASKCDGDGLSGVNAFVFTKTHGCLMHKALKICGLTQNFSGDNR